MWRARGRLVCQFCIVIYFVSLFALSVCLKTCDPHSVSNNTCGENETCLEANGTCQCKIGYELVNGQCKSMPSTQHTVVTTANPIVDKKNNTGGASVAAGLLIPTFLILFGAAMYYGARRYKWVQRFRQFRQNRYGNVLVTRDETDDDDPPIA